MLAPFLITFQVILLCIRDEFLLKHPSRLVWTMYLGGCRKRRAAEFRPKHSVSLILTLTTEFLAEVLESLTEEAEPLGLRVSWIKTEVQASGDILDVTIPSIPVSSDNLEDTQTFTYLRSVIHSSSSCELAVSQSTTETSL